MLSDILVVTPLCLEGQSRVLTGAGLNGELRAPAITSQLLSHPWVPPCFLPLWAPSEDAPSLGPPGVPRRAGITMHVPGTEGQALNLPPNNARADQLLSLPLSFCLSSSQAHGTLRISCRLSVPPSPTCRAAQGCSPEAPTSCPLRLCSEILMLILTAPSVMTNSHNYWVENGIKRVIQFSSVQSLSHVQLLATPWTAACQASLSVSNS